MKRILGLLIVCCCLSSCVSQPNTTDPLSAGNPASAETPQGRRDVVQKLDTFLHDVSLTADETASPQSPPNAAQPLSIPSQDVARASSVNVSAGVYQARASDVQIPLLPQVAQVTPHRERSDQDVGLNFENADIHDVTKVVSEITGKSFIVDDDVQGTVTIYSERSLSPTQVFDLFKSVLELNGLALTQVGEFYKIVTSDTAQKRYLNVDTGTYATPEDNLVTQIVKLRYVKGQDVKKALQSFTASEIIIYPDDNGNTLIITDLASNLRKLLVIIQEMDISQYANRYVEIFPIEHADLDDLLQDLYQILTIPGAAGALNQMAQPESPAPTEEIVQPTAAAQPSGTPVVPAGTQTSLHPIKRLNALLVSTNNPDVLNLVRKWVNILDQSGVAGILPELSSTERTNYVYPVRYSKAEELAPLLAQVYGETAQQQPVQQQPEQQQPEQQQPVTPLPTTGPEQAPVFIPDASTNSLIIRATPLQYAQVLSLLEKLDQRPLQVLIDVLIAEVSLSDSDVFGVKGMLQSQDQLTIGGETNAVNATAETVFEGIAGGSGFNYVLNAPGRFLAQLRALASESRVKVLSDPHIMVRNNQEANINIGDSIPITTVHGTGDTAQETVEYRETGIILRVTPQINYEGDVVLEIEQEVSTPGTRETGAAAPPINRTSATTQVITQDGQPLVIGGLISSRGRNTAQGIPLLKDIPLLGRLFRYNEKQNERKELVILVMPRIVRSSEQGWTLTDDMLQKRVKQLEGLFNREVSDADRVKNFFNRQFQPPK